MNKLYSIILIDRLTLRHKFVEKITGDENELIDRLLTLQKKYVESIEDDTPYAQVEQFKSNQGALKAITANSDCDFSYACILAKLTHKEND